MGGRRPVPSEVGFEVEAEVIVKLPRVPCGIIPNEFSKLIRLFRIHTAIPSASHHGALRSGDEAERRSKLPLFACQCIPRITPIEVRIAVYAICTRVFRIKKTSREEDKPPVAKRPGEGEFDAVVSALPSVDQRVWEETVEPSARVDERVARVGRAPRSRRICHWNVVQVLVVSFRLHGPEIAEPARHAHHRVQALGEIHVGVGRGQRITVGGIRRG